MNASDHIFKLRNHMATQGLDAYIVTSSDPHLSEYLADHWKFREWLTGFTGSAGILVVTSEEAGLWTDSRYFLQAEEQLQESGIDLFRMGEDGVPDYKQWLSMNLLPGSVVGINGKTISTSDYRSLVKMLKKVDVRLDGRLCLEDEIWDSRPPIPEDGIFELSVDYCGQSRLEKIQIIRSLMREKGATHYIVAALDEIAWFLNYRGKDIPFNPVFHAYLIITEKSVNLFIDPHKLTASIGKQLAEDDIKISLYADFYSFIKDMLQDAVILLDPNRLNSTTIASLPSQAAKIEHNSIITTLKAQKNDVETASFRKAMLKDGIALVKFLHWLEEAVGSESLDEYSIAQKLRSFRKEQAGYFGDSFATISGYGPNAAIVHYSAKKDTASKVEQKGFILLDSGGQYPEGTTDITRTIALGPLTDEEKTDYTLVLKGHIAMDQAVFPKGTRGVHLDILARQSLWKNGLNYGHGTGHGIGHFLNVHEGPQSIRPQDNGVEIIPGMITSNEPGVYKAGKHGIRIENLLLCVPDQTTDFGQFMSFETLTLCPIDLKPVNRELLTQTEISWINAYHKKVFDTLAPHLSDPVKTWLQTSTKAI